MSTELLEASRQLYWNRR